MKTVRRREISKAHLRLYECMKDKYVEGDQFTKQDLLEIYNNDVVKHSRRHSNYSHIFTEVQTYQNASQWLDKAISILVRRGYLFLSFKELKYCASVPLGNEKLRI